MIPRFFFVPLWQGVQNCSSGLCDRFRLCFGPRRWRELSDLGDLGRWQAREQILQIIERVDPVTTATTEQRVDYRAPFSRLRMAHEQPIFLSERAGADGVLNEIMPLPDLCRVAA